MGNSTENNSDEKCWICGGSFTAMRPGLVSIGNLMTTHLDCIREWIDARFESIGTRMNDLEAEQALIRNNAILQLETELARRKAALTHSNCLDGQSHLQYWAKMRAFGDAICRLLAQSESMITRLNEVQVDITGIGTVLQVLPAELPPLSSSSSSSTPRLVFGNSGVRSSQDDRDQGGSH